MKLNKMKKEIKGKHPHTFLKHEHDWTNDFYLIFFDNEGNELSEEMLSNIWAGVNDTTITDGQNPNNNIASSVMHVDKNYLHNLWVVGHKGSSDVANWFNNKVSGGHGTAIGIRDDYDQKTNTGLPQNMNFAVSNTLYFNINGTVYYTNYLWGMVGADKWKVFEHLVKDVTVDIFKDTVMDELEIPKEIAETISVMDATTDIKDTWSASENNYYFGVVNEYTEVRKVNWGQKSNKDQSAIITPLVRQSDNQVSDYYVLFKSCNCSMMDSAIGNGMNVIEVYCVIK